MAASKTEKKSKPTQTMAPPPEGAHDGEQKYGFGLGLLIGILLGLFIGAGILLFFEIQRKDVLEEVEANVSQQISNFEDTSSSDIARPTVINDTGSVSNTINSGNGIPEVSQTSPLNEARNVPDDVEIAISFDEPMDADTLNEDTISVFSTNDVKDITDLLEFSYHTESRQVTIGFKDLAQDFGEENVIEVVVSTDAMSASGKALKEPYSFKFVTK